MQTIGAVSRDATAMRLSEHPELMNLQNAVSFLTTDFAPVQSCAVSRACILTGQHSHTHGQYGHCHGIHGFRTHATHAVSSEDS